MVSSSTKAIMIPSNINGIKQAAMMLQKGELVSFPTETVYGLGANALIEQAVLSIFKVKGRPLTDPLIVHVSSLNQALKHVELDDKEKRMFHLLANSFWPGPLTIIAKARKHIPLCVSAGTGYIGIRVPSHPIAREFIKECDVPVVAPSANRFGHVSPTKAIHVMADLGNQPIGIIDNINIKVCEIGIESTVAKINPHESNILIYRRGGISENALRHILNKEYIKPNDTKINIIYSQNSHKKDPIDYYLHDCNDDFSKVQKAPGQLLTHYAPDIQTFLIKNDSKNKENNIKEKDIDIIDNIDDTVIIDFNQILSKSKVKCLAYKDMSPSGNILEAASNLFTNLRWAEKILGANKILLIDVSHIDDEHSLALHDRMFRAASGKYICLKNL